MKSFEFMLLVLVAVSLATVGCTKTVVVEKEKPIYVERQVPAATVPEQPTLNEDKPSPKISVQDDPKGLIKEGAVAEEEHLKKVQKSQDEVVLNPEHQETVEMTVEMKLFDDFQLLDKIYARIMETGFNNNYKVMSENRPNQKHIILKINSNLGPTSFKQTLENTLCSDFAVRVEHRSKHEIVIMPR